MIFACSFGGRHAVFQTASFREYFEALESPSSLPPSGRLSNRKKACLKIMKIIKHSYPACKAITASFFTKKE
jgi:hypothetical protein